MDSLVARCARAIVFLFVTLGLVAPPALAQVGRECPEVSSKRKVLSALREDPFFAHGLAHVGDLDGDGTPQGADVGGEGLPLNAFTGKPPPA